MTMETQRLVRPRDDRWIAGVCAGLGRRFGLSPNLVRLLFALSVLLPGHKSSSTSCSGSSSRVNSPPCAAQSWLSGGDTDR